MGTADLFSLFALGRKKKAKLTLLLGVGGQDWLNLLQLYNTGPDFGAKKPLRLQQNCFHKMGWTSTLKILPATFQTCQNPLFQ